MKSREMRMIFKDLPKYRGYKINYIGELYSVKRKKLKNLEDGSYKLLVNGNYKFITPRELQKTFFKLVNVKTEIIDIYKKISIRKLDPEMNIEIGSPVFMYNSIWFDYNNIIGYVISCDEEFISIELHSSKYEDILYKNSEDYLGIIVSKQNSFVKIILEEKVLNNKKIKSKGFKRTPADSSFKSKYKGTKLNSKYEVIDIYRKCQTGIYKDSEIAKMYGVETRIITNIRYGLTFNDITHHNERTVRENNFEKGSSRYNAVLDETTVKVIYTLCHDPYMDIPLKDIAIAFNVNNTMISRIKHKRTWTHITDTIDIEKFKKEKRIVKLTDEQVLKICELLIKGYPAKDIAAKYNTSVMTIYNIKNRKSRCSITKEIM